MRYLNIVFSCFLLFWALSESYLKFRQNELCIKLTAVIVKMPFNIINIKGKRKYKIYNILIDDRAKSGYYYFWLLNITKLKTILTLFFTYQTYLPYLITHLMQVEVVEEEHSWHLLPIYYYLYCLYLLIFLFSHLLMFNKQLLK